MVRKLFERSLIWAVSGNFNSNGLEVRVIWTWLLLFCTARDSIKGKFKKVRISENDRRFDPISTKF